MFITIPRYFDANFLFEKKIGYIQYLTPIWEMIKSVTLGFYWGREKCEFANCDCIKSFLAFINALTSFIEENLSSPSQKSWTGTEKSMWKTGVALALAHCAILHPNLSQNLITATQNLWLPFSKPKLIKYCNSKFGQNWSK